MVVFINGPATAGKDTLMDLCIEEFKSLIFDKISAVDLPKEAFKLLGWNGEKTGGVRDGLSYLKLLADKEFDMSYNYITDRIKNGKFYNILFVCVRDAETITRCVEFCKEEDFDCVTLLVKRKGVEPITTNEGDRDVYNYNYEKIINNDGTIDQLRSKAVDFIISIL